MEVVEGDLWDFYAKGFFAVIPTNLTVNRGGEAVMGCGVAQQAATRFPELARQYGVALQADDYFKIFHEQRLVMFPVKDHWREPADLEIIRRSCEALRAEAACLWAPCVALPLVGCGFGELKEAQVRPLLELYLPHPCFTLVRRGAAVKARYPRSFTPGARKDVS